MNYSNITRKFNMDTNTWSLMSPMKKERCYFGSMLSFLHKKIYVFGGSNSTKSLNDVECYSIELNSWTSLSLLLP